MKRWFQKVRRALGIGADEASSRAHVAWWQYLAGLDRLDARAGDHDAG